MSTKKKPRAKPAAKSASVKTQSAKAGTAKAPRVTAKTAAHKADAGRSTVKTAARKPEAARSARSAAPSRASMSPHEPAPAASESLLALTTANFAALRKQLRSGGSKRAHAAPAKDDKTLAEALKRLEVGYRDLLRRT